MRPCNFRATLAPRTDDNAQQQTGRSNSFELPALADRSRTGPTLRQLQRRRAFLRLAINQRRGRQVLKRAPQRLEQRDLVSRFSRTAHTVNNLPADPNSPKLSTEDSDEPGLTALSLRICNGKKAKHCV